MPRKVRIEFPGAVYHVLDRGDRREETFRDRTGELCGAMSEIPELTPIPDPLRVT